MDAAAASFTTSSMLKKYKTELCKNWAKGFCQYSSNCLFAHGSHEIREKTLPSKYKTRLCVNMLREGSCKYGDRCQFKHEADFIATAPGSPQHKLQLVAPDFDSATSKRLPIFQQIVNRSSP